MTQALSPSRVSPRALAMSAGMPAVNPWLVALTVSMATFMEVLDTSIANVSLGHIAGNLGAGQNEATWVLTSYLVSNAIILPMSGWLSSVMGRKRFYMTCVALFTISSLLCGLAPSLGWLLFFRVLQGIGGGGLAPSEQSILADTFEPRQRGMAFAVYGVAVVVAPAIGPTLGGWITDNYNWRWIFFINIPVGLLSLFMTYNLVHESKAAVREHKEVWRQGLRIDYFGFALVALGLGALQVVLDKGQEDDWFESSFIQVFTLLALIGIGGAIVWELWFAKQPVVDVALLGNRSLLTTNVLMFIMGFVLNSTTVLLPQFVQQMLGYNATQAGMILMPGGFALMLMFPIAGALSNKVQPKYMMAVGLLITAGALWHLTGFNAQMSFSHLAIARVLQAVGLPLFFVPLNTIAYGDLPPGKNNNASALINLMRNLGGSVGISVAVTLLDRRTQLHQERLVSHLTPFDAPFRQALAHMSGAFASQGAGPVQAKAQALAVIYQLVGQQALMLSYLDVFKVMMIGCLIVVGGVTFLRRVKLGEKIEGH